MLDRHHLLLAAAGSVAGAAAARTALAANSIPPGPPLPPRDWQLPNPTVPYPDPNVQVLDPRFRKYIAGTTLLRRLWTGAEWTEGPVREFAVRWVGLGGDDALGHSSASEHEGEHLAATGLEVEQ